LKSKSSGLLDYGEKTLEMRFKTLDRRNYTLEGSINLLFARTETIQINSET
jgi:hypothetical protein